jgi:hypothetical protein
MRTLFRPFGTARAEAAVVLAPVELAAARGLPHVYAVCGGGGGGCRVGQGGNGGGEGVVGECEGEGEEEGYEEGFEEHH